MAKRINTKMGFLYSVTMTQAGSVTCERGGREYVLAQLGTAGQVTFLALSHTTIVSDNEAIVCRPLGVGPAGGVSIETITALMNDVLFSEQEATSATPEGTSNASFLSMEIAPAYVPEGKLKSVSFLCGAAASTMTSEPFYLALWERNAENSDWVFVGTSTNSATQSNNALIRWDFSDDVELHGRFLFIGGKFDRADESRGSSVNFRGMTSPSDGSTRIFTAVRSYNFAPQMLFTYMQTVGAFAPAEHPADTTAHLSDSERADLLALLERKSDILSLLPETTESQPTL